MFTVNFLLTFNVFIILYTGLCKCKEGLNAAFSILTYMMNKIALDIRRNNVHAFLFN